MTAWALCDCMKITTPNIKVTADRSNRQKKWNAVGLDMLVILRGARVEEKSFVPKKMERVLRTRGVLLNPESKTSIFMSDGVTTTHDPTLITDLQEFKQ